MTLAELVVAWPFGEPPYGEPVRRQTRGQRMTRTKFAALISLATLTVADVAAAHPGHVTPVDGHAHWMALAAGICIIGAAIVAFGLYASSRERVSNRRKGR